LCAHKVSPKIDVTAKENGVIITVDGIEIEITIKQTWRYLKQLQEGEEPEPTVESLRKDLSPYMKDLDIHVDEDKITVKPRRYLGGDFPPVAEIVEFYGGSYISEGRNSRFIIPAEEKKEEPEDDVIEI
jgi:hypothetical protein